MYIIIGESLGIMTLDKFGNNVIIGFIKKLSFQLFFFFFYIFSWLRDNNGETRLVS